jgi:hypothetical protein
VVLRPALGDRPRNAGNLGILGHRTASRADKTRTVLADTNS